MKTYYEINTPEGQKISPKQLSTCIWAAMGITPIIKDITSHIEHLEKNIPPPIVQPTAQPTPPIVQPTAQPTLPTKEVQPEQRTVDQPNKQETRFTNGIPNGGPTKTNGNTGSSDRKPIA